MKNYLPMIIITIQLCFGCADPEIAAQEASEEARETWKHALATLDPTERMSLFGKALEQVEGMVEDYPEASATKEITMPAKRDALTLSKMRATKDAFAQYSHCFAAPTTECVIPLASPGQAEDSEAEPAWLAQRQVCQSDFEQAQTTVAKFKTNRPFYAQTMIDIAFAASKCDKPDAVRSALTVYRDVLPSQGQQRIKKLAQILNTPALSAGHDLIIDTMESDIQTLPLSKQYRAGALLTLAMANAANRQPAKAVKHYNEVTKVLNFRADSEVEYAIALSYLLQGAVSEAFEYIQESGQDFYARRAINEALTALALRYDLLKSKYAITLNINRDKDLKEFLQPVTGKSAAFDLNVIEKIANKLLEKIDSYKVGVDVLGPHGIDTAFALIALLEHKLGAPERAKLSLAKAQSLRTKFSFNQYGRQTYANSSTNYQLQVQALFAIHNDQIENAMRSLSKNQQLRGIWPDLIISQVAATGDVERTLTMVGELFPKSPNSSAHSLVVQTMVDTGQMDNAIQYISVLPSFINAPPGSPPKTVSFVGPIIKKFVDAGDADAVQSFSQQFDLDKSKYGRFQMLENMFKANLKANKLGAAEKVAREAFKLGTDIDEHGAPGIIHNSQVAKTVIWQVMAAGMTDLGFELYRQSPKKDASMLTTAFNGQLTTPQVSNILVLAFDTLTSYERETVFNFAHSWTLDKGNHKS